MLLSKIYILFMLPICQCVNVEIDLVDKSTGKNIKLVCGPHTNEGQFQNNDSVLWKGEHIDKNKFDELSKTTSMNRFVPRISLKSSLNHKCYLLGPKDDMNSPKKRMHRNLPSEASIPAEFGNCPPGYRIDKNRCFACFPGSYTSGQQYECFLCPKNFFVNIPAADSCWPCPEGKLTLKQGADSEEACVYLDDNGHPLPKEEPPLNIIIPLMVVIVLLVWIGIIILLLYWWRNKVDEYDGENVERGGYGKKGRRWFRIRKSKRTDDDDDEEEEEDDDMYSHSDEHLYAKIDDSDEHIYAEIGDFDDDYEIPLKPSGKVQKTSKQESTDSHIYEIPISKSADNGYEVPISKPYYKESIYDDVRLPSDANTAASDENINDLLKKDSTGFEPTVNKPEVKKKEDDEGKVLEPSVTESRNESSS